MELGLPTGTEGRMRMNELGNGDVYKALFDSLYL
jgi:hypothetical protein